ncbi:MAG TPA: SPW repeat protein [Gemmataceae bacterium]|nr:SPW repeat protein [Gemmataceae bacterium]
MATYDYRAGIKTASGLNILAGIWLIISPFVLGFFHYNQVSPLLNTLIAGVIVLILAACRVGLPYRNAWMSWVNLLLGIWLIISPFFLPEYINTFRATPNDVILGIVVGLLAIWSLAATPAVNRGGYAPPAPPMAPMSPR